MKFCVLTADEYRAFLKGNSQASFMQTVEMAEMKKESGSNIHFVGVKENDEIVAGTMILEDKTILNQKLFYAPRGLIVDYHNKELLGFFTKELKKYIKKHGGFILTIDPNVLYRVRTNDGDLLEDDKPNDEAVNNLLDLGYKHYGFNIYLDALQVRWCCRLDLDEDYETKKAKFSKSTRKNIDACYKKGLKVRKGTIEDLDSMTEIFDATSQRKDFQSRSLNYYKKMYNHMKDLMTIYIAYLDPETYLNDTKTLLDNEMDNNKLIKEKMKTSLVGNKLINQKETSDNLIKKYKEELEKAKEFKKENPNGKDIGALLSLKSGDEYLTLSSGMLSEYRNFTPKYAMYNEHIKDAYEMGFEWVDFYGITGCFDKNDKYYGMYEFKKGFNGNVVELVGQFEIKTGFLYDVYNLGKKIKKLLKR